MLDNSYESCDIALSHPSSIHLEYNVNYTESSYSYRPIITCKLYPVMQGDADADKGEPEKVATTEMIDSKA